MSKYDTDAVKTFDNEVVSVLFENQLTTKLDMEQFAHADYELAENAGMKKVIRKYSGNCTVEELAMGEGNTDVMGSSFVEVEYEVGTTQGKFAYYDEQAMNDPDAINKLVEYSREEMVNDMTRKIVAEMAKTGNKFFGITRGFDIVSDAVAAFPDETTEDEGMFLLIARADSSAWRKALKDDLKYVEAFVRKGYIGTICGVPIYWSDAIPTGKAFLGTKEAITIFVKKGAEVEQERDADHRKNTGYIRKVMLVALTNDRKMIELTTAADPATGYTVYTEKPATWDTVEYKTAYTRDVVGEKMVAVDASAPAPEFVAGKFYAKNA